MAVISKYVFGTCRHPNLNTNHGDSTRGLRRGEVDPAPLDGRGWKRARGALRRERPGAGDGADWAKGESMNILDAIRDPNLFGPWFQNRDTWASWRVFVGALFGLPIEDETLYTECTGNRPLPARQAREGYLIVGRRGGKSFICALIGVYLAAFRAYNLSRGESGVVMLLAADRRQARMLFGM
jgi:hypothetical protein